MKAKEQFYNDLTSDIDNSRIKQLILSHKNINKLIENPKQLARKHAQQVQDHEQYLKQFQQRKWLIKKGKKYLIDFDNQQRRQMKQYFNSLDKKNTGSIGIDELEQLLFSVGLFQTRQEIKALIDSVDEDKSGKIQFSQFLSMIQNDQGQNEEIVSFFKAVIGEKIKKDKKSQPYIKNNSKNKFLKNNQKSKPFQQKIIGQQSFPNLHQKSFSQSNHFLLNPRYRQHPQTSNRSKSQIPQILQKYPYPKGLPFEMVVSHIRRKHMMTALNIGRVHKKQQNSENDASNFSTTENTIQQIAKGQRVMHALQKMYQRKLIRQIKQTKRAKQPIPYAIAKNVEDKFRISFTNQNNKRN